LQLFQDIFQGDLCQQDYLDTSLIPEGCSSFINNSSIHGMQIVLIRYFENLKYGLAEYSKEKNNEEGLKKLLNSQQYRDLYLIQFVFVKEVMRKLVHTLE